MDLGETDLCCKHCSEEQGGDELGEMSDSSNISDETLTRVLQDTMQNEEQEGIRMEVEDKRVEHITLLEGTKRRAVQFYHPMTVGSFLGEYAHRKRVRRTALSMMARIGDEDSLQDDQVYHVHRAIGRGGMKTTIHINVGGDLCTRSIDMSDTVATLLASMDTSDMDMVYAGSRLSPEVRPAGLRGDQFVVSPHDPQLPVLRSWEEITDQLVISLGEVLEWFAGPDPGDDIDHDRLQRAVDNWKRYTALRLAMTQYRDSFRGGMPGAESSKGRRQWESTTVSKGLILETEVRVADKALKPLYAESLTDQSSGYALSLIATWQKLQIRPKDPVILIFPGHCGKVLVKLGADATRSSQIEVLLRDDDMALPFTRRVTTLALTDHGYTFGANLAQIHLMPTSNIELVLDFDPKWAAEPTRAMIEKGWADSVRLLLAKMLSSLISDVQIYAHRSPTMEDNMTIWTAKVRLSSDLAEKALAASGVEALFVRPQDVAAVSSRDKYSIVWAARHDQASPARLATILEAAGHILGHRGLARSQSGVGLRTPWSAISEARKRLRPEDPRWLGGTNLDLCDRLTYVARGCPPSATALEVTKAMGELGWRVIPQRQHIKGQHAHWWLTTDAEPPKECCKWGAYNVVFVKQDQEDLDKQRREANKKKEISEKRHAQEHRRRATETPPQSQDVKAEGGMQPKDPLVDKDPWGKYATGSAMTTQYDARINALSARMEAIEGSNATITARVDGLETKMDTMKDGMEVKFGEVLAAIQGLASAQVADGSKRAREGASPPS